MVQMFVPNDCGVITQVISSPVKRPTIRRRTMPNVSEQVPFSQVSQVSNPSHVCDGEDDAHSSDSEDHTEYMPHSEDSGEDSEVVELRRHARKFKKRMRD
jgi:hypothetical protein